MYSTVVSDFDFKSAVMRPCIKVCVCTWCVHGVYMVCIESVSLQSCLQGAESITTLCMVASFLPPGDFDYIWQINLLKC